MAACHGPGPCSLAVRLPASSPHLPVGPGVATAFIGLGVATAAIAALAPSIPGAVALVLAGITGLGALGVALEGHGLFELPLLTHVGLIFGTNLAAALAAGLSQYALDRVQADWVRIGWRVVASWIGAILVLYFAFEVTGGVS
jgi:hypothetical protein